MGSDDGIFFSQSSSSTRGASPFHPASPKLAPSGPAKRPISFLGWDNKVDEIEGEEFNGNDKCAAVIPSVGDKEDGNAWLDCASLQRCLKRVRLSSSAGELCLQRDLRHMVLAGGWCCVDDDCQWKHPEKGLVLIRKTPLQLVLTVPGSTVVSTLYLQIPRLYPHKPPLVSRIVHRGYNSSMHHYRCCSEKRLQRIVVSESPGVISDDKGGNSVSQDAPGTAVYAQWSAIKRLSDLIDFIVGVLGEGCDIARSESSSSCTSNGSSIVLQSGGALDGTLDWKKHGHDCSEYCGGFSSSNSKSLWTLPEADKATEVPRTISAAEANGELRMFSSTKLSPMALTPKTKSFSLPSSAHHFSNQTRSCSILDDESDHAEGSVGKPPPPPPPPTPALFPSEGNLDMFPMIEESTAAQYLSNNEVVSRIFPPNRFDLGYEKQLQQQNDMDVSD